MKMLPKGKYVLFAAFRNYDELVYGIFERKEFQLEATCDRDKMYRCISVSDDKEFLMVALKELNVLNSMLREADEVIEKLTKIHLNIQNK